MALRTCFFYICVNLCLTTFGQAPVISSFSPTSGPIGTSVTITGTGFNATPSLNNVMFGATRATVTAASATSLTVAVPIGATYERFWVTNLVTNLTGYSGKPFMVTQPGSITYSAKQAYTMDDPYVEPYVVGLGDFDSDGKSDLAVTSASTFGMAILRNNGTPGAISFEASTLLGTGSMTVFDVADIDGDGKSDIVVPNFGGAMNFFRNTTTTGGISFSASTGASDGNCFSLVINDFDGDGKPDYAASFAGDGFVVYRNGSSPGNISFALAHKIRPNNNNDGVQRVAVGDLDGDGKSDLVALNITTQVIHVYRNTSTPGSITFAARVDFPMTGSNLRAVFLGDLDGDNKADLAITNQATFRVSVHRNTSTLGSIGFAPVADFPTFIGPRFITEGDLDGDGKPDLVIGTNLHGSDKLAVIRNTSTTGTMSFEAPLALTADQIPSFAAIGDLDGDLKPDLVTANGSVGSSTLSFFRQYTPVVVSSFSPSSGCAGTGTVVITGSGFNFTSRVTIGGTDVQSFTVDSPTQITATLGNGTSGVIEVTADITGISTDAFTVNNIPAQPAAISGDAAICVGDAKTYSIAAVSGATSYSWTLPSGWTGSSTTNSINTTASITSGNISVTANNTCGISAARTLAIAVNSIPAQPGIISGDGVLCASDNRTYNITTVSGATNYTWTLPSGWTGSSATNSINITASATSGNVSITANNACGSSPAQTLVVTANSAPPKPGIISGDAILYVGDSKTYGIALVSGATNYTWTLPSGWTGTSTTNSIDVIASATSGNVSVTANNSCGSSPAQLLAVTTNKKNQTIAFGALPWTAFGDAPFTLNAIASSGLPVNYNSSNASVATISGNTITIIGAGSTTVTASQAGDASFNAAPDASQIFTVNIAGQDITFGSLADKTFGDASFTLTATASSGLPVSYFSSDTNVATVDGNTVTIVSAGTTTITAFQDGDVNYDAANNIDQTFTINKASQSITFDALPDASAVAVPFVLVATASSGLPVSYLSSNTNVATVSGNTLTIVGAGVTTISAAQTGNANYKTAPDVLQTLTVNKASQDITFGLLTNKTFGDAPFTLTATASSGLPVSYSSSDTNVVAVSGNTVTIIGAGVTTITASQLGNDNYTTANTLQQTFTVEKLDQVITFSTLNDKTIGDAAFNLTAAASSGLVINYTSASDKISINGDWITFIKAGRVVITAAQEGNVNYKEATSAIQSFCVKPAKPMIISSGENTAPILTSSEPTGNQWYFNGDAITGATSSSFNATQSGVYKVQAKADDCVGEFSSDQITVVTGIENNAYRANVTAYPNPTSSWITVAFDNLPGKKKVTIFDLNGKEKAFLEVEEREARIQIADYASGLYVIKVQAADALKVIKFVKD